ncbi:hypothetical protein JRO89_XS01G0148000 [Xanthoceras sorbifolium]|uniref:Uncharacterized protein n=1 Tax=Xanthoceras sorbifolium TaxID=99658 RepID=A0ABQ8IJC4_9ROSI|nr:hypothetical protein JRO89_XS01G0148000 [Xanthoceras sorbifolium]
MIVCSSCMYFMLCILERAARLARQVTGLLSDDLLRFVDVVMDSNSGIRVNLVVKGPTTSIGNCRKEESFPANIDEDKRGFPSKKAIWRIKIFGENCTASCTASASFSKVKAGLTWSCSSLIGTRACNATAFR